MNSKIIKYETKLIEKSAVNYPVNIKKKKVVQKKDFKECKKNFFKINSQGKY